MAEAVDTMEALYESLFTSEQLFCDQLLRWVQPELAEDAPLVVLVDPDRNVWSSDTKRFGEVFADRKAVESICERIDDGIDPVVCCVGGQCVAACELFTEKRRVGYLLLGLSNHTPEHARQNMDLIELIFAQFRLICSLIEKNNEFHQLRLVHLSKNPSPIHS